MPERITNLDQVGVTYIETTLPNSATECDVYKFNNDVTRDVAVISIKPNGKTPRQRVVRGDKTIEGFISGSGDFHINDTVYQLPNPDAEVFVVSKNDVMQWVAGSDGLTFYEICTPPYADGRFEDLEDEGTI